jgi:hypothetical protein
MKSINQMDSKKVSMAFNEACSQQSIPEIQYCDYHVALDNTAFLICKAALLSLGFSPNKASRLAGSHGGSARQRFETIRRLNQ